MESATVVAIDSDLRLLNYMRAVLLDGKRDVAIFDSGRRAIDCMRAGLRPKVVLLAVDLPDIDCLDLIRQIHQLNPHINVAVMSYLDCHEDVVEAIRAGARQILPKPFLSQDLVELVSQLVGDDPAPALPDAVEVKVGERMSLVYASPLMRELEQQSTLIARVNLPVLILGESGTGKEILARHIHNLSSRAGNTFLKMNCAAVPSELLESELFGYESGAFTGARGPKPGKFKLCNHGTMFLDEIGEMHPALQAKLLQVLQDGTYAALGSRTTERVDVRIIAATNIDMKMAIANRTFREDLYYRLNGFCVKLPPLRERREDIPVLLHYFMRRHAPELGLSDVQPSPSARMVKACLRYHWPGNARELESFAKRYLVLGDEQLMIDELKEDSSPANPPPDITPESILQALQSSGGNRREAAKTLGVSYKVLLSRLRQFGMEPEPSKEWVNT
ncbi:MAG TPA: sigma-54 dependent transcriptional regulator [Dongiaceae bacterium]|nr:sigma-54 dependent transcriptional regulator [Dongiaceae bacterium]